MESESSAAEAEVDYDNNSQDKTGTMRNEFEYTYMLKVCQNLNFLYGIDAWVSSFPSLANVGEAILNRTPKFRPMPVLPFIDLLKDYVRAFYHLKK